MASKKPKIICTLCGTQGYAEKYTPGHFMMEVLLWLMFLLPGLIYSIWRLAGRRMVCQKCRSSEIVPVDSPKGRLLARSFAEN